MPEMTFGRAIRYRRTKLGLSQTRLGELVGRSAAAVRSWERDTSTPSDPSVLQALSAVLGIDLSVLSEKAGVDTPLFVETSPTIEESLGSLAPTGPKVADWSASESGFGPEIPEEDDEAAELDDSEENLVAVGAALAIQAEAEVAVAPRPQYIYTSPAPPLAEATYMEDESQRQMYRVRHLATLVVVVALVGMFLWAMGNGWDAFTGWWSDFVGNLQL